MDKIKEYKNYYRDCNKRMVRKELTYNTIIYRIENAQGEGPFKTLRDEFKAEAKKVFKPSKLLSLRPDQDFKTITLVTIGFYHNELRYNFRFGCTSIGQLRKWCSKEQLDMLRANGYRIVKYQVQWALVSQNQCIFDITKAQRI